MRQVGRWYRRDDGSASGPRLRPGEVAIRRMCGEAPDGGASVALWGPVVALACAAAIFAPALDPSRALLGRDLPHHFYPLGKVVAAAAHDGVLLPRRDPTRGLGLPLVPDMLAESFYPPRVIRAVLPYPLGFKLWLLLHLALLGVAAAALARALGASAAGVALAAAAGTACGPSVSIHLHPNLLAGTGWCTLALAALVGAGRRRLTHVVAAAVATALAVLAGGIETVLGLALALATLAVAGAPGRAARGVLALGLGGALAAIQLVPAWVAMGATERAGPVGSADASIWSMHPGRLVGIVAPSVFRLERLFPWSELFEANTYREPLLSSLYLSLPVLMLAAIAVLRLPGTRAVACAAAVLTVAAMGRFGAPGELPSLMDALRLVPPYDRFRYPEKLFPLAATLLAGLGGVGFTRLLRQGGARAFVLGLLASSVLCLVVAVCVRASPALPSVDASVPIAVRMAIDGAVVAGFARAGLLGIACAGAAALAGRLRRLGLAAGLIGSLIVVDLLVDARGQLTIGPARWLDQPPASARAILADPRGDPPPRVVYGLASVSFQSADLPEAADDLRLAFALVHRETLIGGYAGLFGLEQAWMYGPFTPTRLHALHALGAQHPDRLAYLASIGAVTLRREDRFAPHWPRAPLPGSGFLLARAVAGPRARVVSRARTAPDLASAQALVAAAAYDPRRETVVESTALPRGDGTPPTVTMRSREPNRIEVALDPPPRESGVLVLAELFVEGGWQVTVDGVPGRPLPADVALVSVVVPAGARSVVFEARTPGLATGAAISAAAALVAVGLVVVAGRR